MRRPIIVGNWKMHKTTAEAVALVQDLRASVAEAQGVDIGVAPPYTALMAVAEVLRGASIFVAAQNLHWEPQGAFTGEISAAMLRDVGCTRVVVGHSERRQLFAETDATVNRKLKAALNAQLDPIFCIGETLAQRESNTTFSVLEQQVRQGLADIPAEGMSRVVIAYEPVWAIGTGQTATPAQATSIRS
jgi:triosephosphate isomerase